MHNKQINLVEIRNNCKKNVSLKKSKKNIIQKLLKCADVTSALQKHFKFQRHRNIYLNLKIIM